MSNPINHLGLLVIDLQDTFLKTIPDSASLIRRCSFAIEAAQLLGARVAATEQIPEKLGHTTEAIKPILLEATPTFEKSAFSAMQATGIRRWIESSQIDHLLLIGIETPICIYQTAIDAAGAGTGVTLLSDCVSERRENDRAPIFQQLRSMDVHILPSETVFYSLLGSATHPDFRGFTKLVKQYT